MASRAVGWLLALALCAGCSDPQPSEDGCEKPRGAAIARADHSAADGLWMIESGRPPRSVSVERLLDHPSPRVRRRAALAAGRIAVKGLSRRLRRLLGDEDSTVRASAAWALGLAGDAQGEHGLILRMALDDSLPVRVAALRALGLVGGVAAARAILALLRASGAPGHGSLRAQAWRSLALLARRGSTLTRAAIPHAIALLEGTSAGLEERRGAAYLLATLARRFLAARKVLLERGKQLSGLFEGARDAETHVQLGRLVIRLGLVQPVALGRLAREGGALGRLALSNLAASDLRQGKVLGPLGDDLVKVLSKEACKTIAPVVLWQLLGELAPRPRGGWVKERVASWLKDLRKVAKSAPAGSCVRGQLARLACRAAALADISVGRVGHLVGCGAGALSAGEELRFLAWGVARGAGRHPLRRLRRIFLQGGATARAAALSAAAHIGGAKAHGLVSRGLASGSSAVFAAAAAACGELLKVRGHVGARGGRRSCLLEARRQLLHLSVPVTRAQLPRWLELVRLVRGIGDSAVVSRLKVAAGHFHPTLRRLARASLSEVLGRPPATDWSADRRRPPVEPLSAPVDLTLRTAAGSMVLRLRPDWAPMSAAYVLRLVQQGAYSGAVFHRVVPGFVIQGGDSSGTGFGGDLSFGLSEPSGARFVRGVVGLAHAGRDTESRQFFILLGSAPHLDGRYTAFAQVVSGLEVAERLLPGARFQIEAPRSAPRVAPMPRAPAPAPRPAPTPVPAPTMKISPGPPGRAPVRPRPGAIRVRPRGSVMAPVMGFIRLSKEMRP